MGTITRTITITIKYYYTTLLITCSRLSVAQTNFCFKHLNTCTPTYATPTFITATLHLVTYLCTAVLNDCKIEVMAYTVLACSYYCRLLSMMCFSCKATPTNDIDCSCHSKALELI